MAGGLRRCILALILTCICVTPLLAQAPQPASVKTTAPTAVVDDASRLLQLGQFYMGQNNPDYALKPADLDMQTRNDAGEQALRIFQQITTRYPKYGDGWLWLGIALTETRRYSKKSPNGEPKRTANNITEGVRAFRTAHECKPNDIVYAVYYGEALMAYCEDFEGARKFWGEYLRENAKTDMQRVMALTQSARACLNKAYFGKISKKLPAAEIKQLFADSEDFIRRAAKLCPQAPDVKAMQSLLEQYRSTLSGK